MPAIIAVMIFISSALLSVALLCPLLGRRDAVRERLAKLVSHEEQGPLKLIREPGKWQQYLSNLGNRLKQSPKDLGRYRTLLTAAGFRPENVYVLLGCKFMLAVLLSAGCLTVSVLQHGRFGTTASMTAVAAAITGYLLPTFWLRKTGNERKIEIFHSLPDVMDLLTVCVEAGLSLNAALVKTAEIFQNKNNPLVRELSLVTQEIRVGKPRTEALEDLARRTMVDDIKSFVAMLTQTEKFGTSLGTTLRTYSDSLRMKRRQLAEEKAAKTSIKMLFPLIFFIFPSLLIVILTPALFRITALLTKL